MSVVAIVLLALFVVFVGMLVALRVVIFVTALIETRPVRHWLVPAPVDDLAWSRHDQPSLAEPAVSGSDSNPYASPAQPDYESQQNRAAAVLGFTLHGVFAHAKGGYYKERISLWLSPDQRTLAAITWGTIARLPARKTRLCSRRNDGSNVLTCDRPVGNSVPGFDDTLIVLGAPLELLARRHVDRLEALGSAVIPFEGNNLAQEYEDISFQRAHFLIERGAAYFTDEQQTAIRSTLKGAFGMVVHSFGVSPNIERVSSTADASTSRPLQPHYPAPIVWGDRVVFVLILASLILLVQGSSAVPEQRLVRLAVSGLTLVAIPTVWLLKLAWRLGTRQ